ncbi:carbonic anhydrase family protein [Neopusillimonas aromaticivorans]|uniref:carbonic anhydrase family protein n=1 Tax=Neopusillimonas aromaticivorans TaxID=2979868 RepID=UPI002598126C|nr:carbonic anhydrase family protein [Neopusillimonas aromaticivorans]WJJ93814.1 carbonic anhydrase family protein [Neopusillimonas aromaticivorans]
MQHTPDCCPDSLKNNDRRHWLMAGFGLSVAAAAGLSVIPATAAAVSLTQAQRDAMTPDQVIDMLQQGNARFRSGKMQSHDFLAQKRATATGQYPAAVILSCIDSRAPGEIIFDTGIGDAFGARIAGNIATPDLIGSMEFACAVAGAKLVLVLGHTGCGAIAGAINGVKLGNLTGLLQQIEPAVKATTYDGERTGSNRAFVDAVARQNVQLTVNVIRQNSAILAGLEKDGKIKMIGAMYDLSNGEVAFLH